MSRDSEMLDHATLEEGDVTPTDGPDDAEGWTGRTDRVLRRAGSNLGRAGNTLRRAALNYLGVGGVLLLLCTYLTITEDQFATYDNFVLILETNAVLLVVAVGVTFVVLSRGFDLSLGGILALTGVMMHELIIDAGLAAGPAIVLAVLLAIALGLVNGMLIGKVGLSFIVVTLGTASLYRGIALVRTEGQSQPLFEQQFLRSLGSDRVWGVPWLVVVALSVLGIGIMVMRYTGYGRMVHAVGGNPVAARLAGINVTMVQVSVYALAGGLAGVAAVLDAGRLTSASPIAGTGIELTAGAAVLLGGTTFFGGRGTLLGTLLGVLFLGVLANGITLAGVSPFWQGIVAGIVLILALAVDRLRAPRSGG